MRKSILLTSLLTLFTAAGAQSQPLSVGTQGSKAILFNFAGLSALNLTAYQGGLGGKYFISNGQGRIFCYPASAREGDNLRRALLLRRQTVENH